MSDQSKNWLDEISQVSKMLSDVSKRSSQLDQLLRTFQLFSSAMDNPSQMKDILQNLSKLNIPSTGKTKEKGTSNAVPTTSTPKTPEKTKVTGDPFYDIFNSPNMIGIVKEVMKKRGKK
ncbi:hypothetical protein [Risungbinella massiliensis]|uniref:hypothetical protein n=1 Tax=Risungbinella massiliensis TaxID=1329796 RepID=UPI0005CC5CE2|nr:hypothetical protein [Risungbinella massiliensis]